jgi:hypothetical protein
MKALSLTLSFAPAPRVAAIFEERGEGLAFGDAGLAATAVATRHDPRAIIVSPEIILDFFISIVRLSTEIRHLSFAPSSSLGCKTK